MLHTPLHRLLISFKFTGALFNIFFNALAAGVPKAASEQNSDKATSAVWAGAINHALTSLYQYTAARKPSRTLVDPLEAFNASYSASKGADLAAAVKEAAQATEETKNMVAKAGRAAYVGQDELKKQQVPDPGAFGIVKMMEGIQSAIA
jgi:dihydroxyacetone kinase